MNIFVTTHNAIEVATNAFRIKVKVRPVTDYEGPKRE
jgi:hypothetical protein